MLMLGIIVGFFTGRINEVTKAIIDSSNGAITLAMGLLGILCFWTGLMEILSRAGLIEKIGKLIKPITRFLFPKVSENHPSMAYIVMNMVANFLGLGNAATPLGLKAMQELHKLNNKKDSASDEMCMFLVVNTCSIQLIPATIIALRSAAGSKDPTGVIVGIWIVSLCSACIGIFMAKLLSKTQKNKTPS